MGKTAENSTRGMKNHEEQQLSLVLMLVFFYSSSGHESLSLRNKHNTYDPLREAGRKKRLYDTMLVMVVFIRHS
jgi:hypothetical protein